jgi:hypothetical protein
LTFGFKDVQYLFSNKIFLNVFEKNTQRSEYSVTDSSRSSQAGLSIDNVARRIWLLAWE